MEHCTLNFRCAISSSEDTMGCGRVLLLRYEKSGRIFTASLGAHLYMFRTRASARARARALRDPSMHALVLVLATFSVTNPLEHSLASSQSPI